MNRTPRAVLGVIAGLLLGLAPGAAAHAHPLGNFSVNRLDQLRLLPDRIEDAAVVDTAEIPTAQDRETADTDHDGVISPTEAAARCTELAAAIRADADGQALSWRVAGSALEYHPGAAGLPTTRLACTLTAPAALDRPAEVRFVPGTDSGRLGWKEITAAGDGLRLTASSVPAESVSAGLSTYPQSLLDRPPATLTADLRTAPNSGEPASTTARTGAAPPAPGGWVPFPGLERWLSALVGTRDLTLPVGLLAVALALLLGAGHAALPGHAKLAVAACLAQRRGGLRAALAVGATVTVTHTAGVLLTGLLLTASVGLAGERLLGWLGLLGGVLITVIGGGLLYRAVRVLRGGTPHRHHPHDHGHHHHHHPHRRRLGGLASLLGIGLAGGLVPSPSALVVLLGAVALGRTAFGVLLVIGYGAGMALALAAAGALLAGGSTRLADLTSRRLPTLRRLAPYSSLLTAGVVLTVGLGLTLRGLPGVPDL
ncbi:nickel transporter [Kitasatospora sp. NPDC050463]|uniref:nickel transporter n=1 Tax=Kitasatospora sp. NPDC050463 TaxID=3155786 RepID=UPI0033CF4DAC